MNETEARRERPWTVVALVVWSIGSAIWGLLFGNPDSTYLLSLPLGALFIWGFWTGRAWAFSISYACALISAVALIVFVVTGSTRIDLVGKIVWFLNVAGTLYLLRHPATKRFIGVEKASQAPAGPPDRGGRVAQATAISLFGVLAVGLPLLWALDLVPGGLLLVGVVACVGAGAAVLFLGLPARTDQEEPLKTS